MKATKETYQAAALFAAKDGLDSFTFSALYKDSVAYYATSDALEGTCFGYPQYVLVSQGENGLQCRYSTPDEALEIIDLEN